MATLSPSMKAQTPGHHYLHSQEALRLNACGCVSSNSDMGLLLLQHPNYRLQISQGWLHSDRAGLLQREQHPQSVTSMEGTP